MLGSPHPMAISFQVVPGSANLAHIFLMYFLPKKVLRFFLPQFHLTQLSGCYPNLSCSPIGSPKHLAYSPTQSNAALLPWETVIKISFTSSLKIIFGRDAKVNEFLLLLIWLQAQGIVSHNDTL